MEPDHLADQEVREMAVVEARAAPEEAERVVNPEAVKGLVNREER